VASQALNNAVCNSDYIASGAWLIFNKLRRTWKEGGVVEFHVQPRDLPGGAEKNKKKSLSGYPVYRMGFEPGTF
jgi:hypothetical protein